MRQILVLIMLLFNQALWVSHIAFEFSVCSPSGGSHGVDFRSHFSVYCAEHKIRGWVRNACNDCVYGQFGSDGEEAFKLSQIIASPDRIKAELASKAANLSTTINKIDSYPLNKCSAPDYYLGPIALVDWSYATDCASACECLPTHYTDCQQTSPLPDNVTYTKDCQREPLGDSTKNFADCNSVHTMDEIPCFSIVDGEIVDSDRCSPGWVEKTYAARKCCEHREDKAPFGRQGIAIPPAPANCAAYPTDASYLNKCPAKFVDGVHYQHPLE